MVTITIFGASGLTGREIADTALSNGFTVRIVVRNKDHPIFKTGIEPITCDMNNLTNLKKAIKGSDAVIIVFGPRPPYTDIFCEHLTKNIIKVMEQVKVKRLICQTGAMIGDYQNNRSYLFELMSAIYKKSSPVAYQDRVNQEKLIRASSLEWTIIKPPRLTMDTAKSIKAGETVKIGMLSTASRKSIAKFIINEIQTPKFIHKAVFIKN